MTADQRGPRLVQHGADRRHRLVHRPRLEARRHARQRQRDQRRLRHASRRQHVVERVDRRDPRDEVGVAREGGQRVGAEELGLAADPQRARVSAGPHDHVAPRRRRVRRSRQHPRQRPPPRLRAAAAAERVRRDALRRRLAGGGRGHDGQLREPAHEAPVDVVLERPEERALRRQARPVEGRAPRTRRDELQVVALRLVGSSRRLPPQRRAEVRGQHRGLPHGEDARLLARRVRHARAVARREDLREAHRAQRLVHDDLSRGARQRARREPGVRRRPRRADGEANGHEAVLGAHAAGLDGEDAGPLAHRHGRRLQRCAEPSPRARRRLGQDRPRLDQGHLGAWTQPMRHGEAQLDARDAAADHRARPCAAPQEGVPAIREDAERLGGHAVFGEAGHAGDGAGDADIDAEHVVGDGRASRHGDGARVRVDPVRRAEHQPRARVAAERHEVDVQRVARVVPGDVARQHPGVGRGGLGADQRQPRAGQGVHPPGAQDQRVRVAPAEQHEVAAEPRALTLPLSGAITHSSLCALTHGGTRRARP